MVSRVRSKDGVFMPEVWPTFSRACIIVQGLGLRSQSEWRSYVKTKEFDRLGLPSTVSGVYAAEWKGWPHFLTGIKPERKLLFSEARVLCRESGFLHGTDYIRRYKEVSDRLPSEPWIHYKDEWMGWADYLGCLDLSTLGKQFISLDEAAKLAKDNDISSQCEWREFTKTAAFKSARCPTDPSKIYKEEWTSWTDFFQSERKRVSLLLCFSEAHKIALTLGIRSQSEWGEQWGKLDLFKAGIPRDPRQSYREWVS